MDLFLFILPCRGILSQAPVEFWPIARPSPALHRMMVYQTQVQFIPKRENPKPN